MRGGVHVGDQFEKDVEAFFAALPAVLDAAGQNHRARLSAYRQLMVTHRMVGFGIPEEYGGSGLGLSISKQFIELHHGRMSLETEVGVGTTFSLFFPLPPESHPA